MALSAQDTTLPAENPKWHGVLSIDQAASAAASKEAMQAWAREQGWVGAVVVDAFDPDPVQRPGVVELYRRLLRAQAAQADREARDG